MKALADWRKSSLFFSTKLPSTPEGDVRKETASASDSEHRTSGEASERRAGSAEHTRRPRSSDHQSIERARRDSISTLCPDEDTGRKSLADDVITVPITMQGDAAEMYTRPRSLEEMEMFDMVHASIWLWQESTSSLLWANNSAEHMHRFCSNSPDDIAMMETARPKFERVERGITALYLKGPLVHVLPHACTSSKEGDKDVVEAVVKPFCLRISETRIERCCMIEILTSLTQESLRDVEMFHVGTGNVLLAETNGNVLCKKHSSPILAGVTHLFDMLSGSLAEKHQVLDDVNNRLYQTLEDVVYLTDQNDETQRWSALELRSSRDPVTYRPAIFVSVSDVTDMKTAELQLMAGFHDNAKGFPSRGDASSDWDGTRSSLEGRTNRPRMNTTSRHSVQLGPSPAEMVTSVLDELIDGQRVPRERLLRVQQAFTGDMEHCFQPVNVRSQLSLDLDNHANRVIWELLGDEPDRYRAVPAGDVGRQWSRESLDMQATISGSHVRRAETWDFDVFRFAEQAQNRPLTALAMHVLEKEGLVAQFSLNPTKLRRFLGHIERGYPDNPYHNRIHASGVLQLTYMILSWGGVKKTEFQPQAVLSCYLAAITHDFIHPGRTADFLVQSGDDLAVTYNDLSPLENHHVSQAWRIMMRPECNFMEKVPTAVRRDIRKTWIDLVMATDMKRHFAILAQFKSQTTSRHATSGSAPSSAHEMEPGHAILLQMILKIADLGHLASPPHLHRRWVALLEEELFRQGDVERKKGYTVSPFMDRSQPGITSTQTTFFEIVAIPTFEVFTTAMTGVDILIANVRRNYEGWTRDEYASSIN